MISSPKFYENAVPSSVPSPHLVNKIRKELLQLVRDSTPVSSPQSMNSVKIAIQSPIIRSPESRKIGSLSSTTLHNLILGPSKQFLEKSHSQIKIEHGKSVEFNKISISEKKLHKESTQILKSETKKYAKHYDTPVILQKPLGSPFPYPLMLRRKSSETLRKKEKMRKALEFTREIAKWRKLIINKTGPIHKQHSFETSFSSSGEEQIKEEEKISTNSKNDSDKSLNEEKNKGLVKALKEIALGPISK